MAANNQNQQHHEVVRLLRRSDVEARTGLKRSSIYNLMALGDFPQPVNLIGRAVAWPSNQVDAWIARRIAGQSATASGTTA